MSRGSMAGGSRGDLAALVSVHDLAPPVMPAVHRIRKLLRDHRARRATLLVVPGAGWPEAGLADLRRLQGEGCVLAAHGWSHRAGAGGGPRHRVYRALISRNAAEHLSLTRDEERDLIRRSHAWFREQALATPRLYVPPAWAMLCPRPAALRQLPFDQYEVLSGVLDVRSGSLQRLPVAGFEADTPARALFLRGWNALNRHLARLFRRPLRIAIHPHDLSYALQADLVRTLDCVDRFLSYDALSAGLASD